jgi:hypothetical protein
MMRLWLASAAVTALSAAAAPALAQTAPLEVPRSGRTDPPAQRVLDVHAGPYAQGAPALPVYPGAPYAQPLPPGATMPAPPVPGPLWAGGAAPPAYGAMAWQGPGPVIGANYAYGAGNAAGAVPCGCGGGYTVNWVPVQVETRYSYSPAIRHERQVVENVVVPHEVVETRTVPVRQTKYVKTARPTKMTKVRVTKRTK